MVESQENRSDDVAKGGISAMLWRPGVLVPVVLALVGTVLSLIHISEPTRRYASSYAVFCLK